MGQIQYITGINDYEGLSLRQICKKTGHHFNTVKKYVDCDNWNEEVTPRKVRDSKLDPLKPIIDEWLKNDLKMPRKQRHTGTKVYNRLKNEKETKSLLLKNAHKGNLDNGFAFAGSNAYRAKKIISVKELVEQINTEYNESL